MPAGPVGDLGERCEGPGDLWCRLAHRSQLSWRLEDTTLIDVYEPLPAETLWG